MFEELKATGSKYAARRFIFCLIAAALLFILFHLNVFKLSPGAIERWRYVVYGIFALFAAASVVNFVNAKNNSLFKGIENFCKTAVNSEDTMRRLEKTWEEGFDFKAGRIDKDYIICLLGMSSKVIPLENVVCAYKIKARRIAHTYLFVCFDDFKYKPPAIRNEEITLSRILNAIYSHSTGCNMRNYESAEFQNEGVVDAILNYISENCPDIATGREKEIENLYNNKDMEGLRKYARAMRNRNVKA